ncbi:MAG: hypothetical protein V3V05_02640 [Pontiella sp.]
MNDKIQEILKKTSKVDFDGHTEFSTMTPDQRLSWLDEANAAYLELYALARPEIRVAEEPPTYGADAE